MRYASKSVVGFLNDTYKHSAKLVGPEGFEPSNVVGSSRIPNHALFRPRFMNQANDFGAAAEESSYSHAYLLKQAKKGK